MIEIDRPKPRNFESQYTRAQARVRVPAEPKKGQPHAKTTCIDKPHTQKHSSLIYIPHHQDRHDDTERPPAGDHTICNLQSTTDNLRPTIYNPQSTTHNYNPQPPIYTIPIIYAPIHPGKDGQKAGRP
ncbi:hypothetical protein JHW43_004417 [Diplocarpon mali]|nr:hypothetical protein JHW43_004417 [Diplocarpon mali]